MAQRVGPNAPRKGVAAMADTIPPTGEDMDASAEPDGHEVMEYRRAVTHEWVDGLMQRINCALASNTALTVCPRDLDALNFVMVALGCVDVDAILGVIAQSKEQQVKAEEGT